MAEQDANVLYMQLCFTLKILSFKKHLPQDVEASYELSALYCFYTFKSNY